MALDSVPVVLSFPLGLVALASAAVLVSVPLVVPIGAFDGDELDRGLRVGLWRSRGVGKFDFLSMD